MLISSVTQWRAKVLQVLNAWLGLEPVWVDRVISDAGLTRDLFAEVILSIIQQESRGNASAIGDGGCSFGLMQFNWCLRQSAAGRNELQYPADAGNGEIIRRLVTSSTQLYDPYINIGVGMHFFLLQLEKFNDVPLAIEAYNNPDRSFFNQPYLDSVLAILGRTADFFESLKKKPSRQPPVSAWSQLVAWLSGWRSQHGGASRSIYYVIDLNTMQCVGVDGTLSAARKRCTDPNTTYALAVGVLWQQRDTDFTDVQN